MVYYIPPSEKVGGHVPRVPHQIAPMLPQPIAYGGGVTVLCPPSDPKNKKMYKQYSAVA